MAEPKKVIMLNASKHLEPTTDFLQTDNLRTILAKAEAGCAKAIQAYANAPEKKMLEPSWAIGIDRLVSTLVKINAERQTILRKDHIAQLDDVALFEAMMSWAEQNPAIQQRLLQETNEPTPEPVQPTTTPATETIDPTKTKT